MTSLGPPTMPIVLEEVYDRTRRAYGAAIGRHRSELVTPALVLELPAAKRNIKRMAERVRELGAELRPHIKVHKSPELASLQVQAGAIGLCTATVWEAIALIRSGLDHIFVANTVAGPRKMQVLAELAREADVMVAIDELANAQQLAAVARAAGSELAVLIEVDTGMDRAGVDTPEQALELARQIDGLAGLRLRGLTGYEGHCSLTPEREQRLAKQSTAMAFLVGVAELLEGNGLPCPIRSAGGTATWNWTANYPGVSEIQAGTYVVMDNFHGRMVDGFEHSLTVQATVISRRPDRVIVDAGSKSMGAGDLSAIVGHALAPLRFDEEHGIFAAPDGSPLVVGDTVALVPGYSPSTVNWYDAYHVIDHGVVQDIWPIIPRGPGHNGFIG